MPAPNRKCFLLNQRDICSKKYLAQYDEFKRFVDDAFEMPDKLVALLVSGELGTPIDIKEQVKRTFWIPASGYPIKQNPDIVIEAPNGKRIILDTKWKIIHTRPSEADLRQMYTYNQLFESSRSYLIYPGVRSIIAGEFFNNEENGDCGLSFVPFISYRSLSSLGIEIFIEKLLNSL